MKALHTVEKTLVLERTPFLASRLLNHSRFPDGRAHGFAALANIGALRAGHAQPLYLLTPPGRFGPSAQVSRLLNHSRFPNGRAHGFAAPLRVALRFAQVPTGHTLPFAPQGTRFLPAHLRVALVPSGPSAHRAHTSLRRRAGGEFAPGAQPFLTPLPARGPSEGGREGSGATPSEKIANGELFRRALYALNCA